MRSAVLLPAILLAVAAASAQQQDFSKVEIKSTRLTDNLYLLQGAGGNIAAVMGADGVLLVDDQYAELSERIRAAVQGLGVGDPTVRFVVNTHYHYDHTGGNLPFARAGAVLIAHDALRSRFAAGGIAGNGGSLTRPVPAAEPRALPVITFDHELTVHLDGEDIRVVHYPNAHTDGDSVVYFPQAHAVHMGDIFVRYGFPFIDVNGGGSVQGMIAACEEVLRTLPAEARIIPGHGELADPAALREYLQMLKDTSAAVGAALRAGKSLEQMKQAHLLGAWSERYSPAKAFVDTDAFTESLYHSLTQHAARHGPAPRPH
jgi:cyclase